MDLDLDITPRSGRGRPRRVITAEYLRDITEADIALHATVGSGAEVPTLKRVSERHHMLARLLAAGVTEGEASVATGYDPSRISVLKQSPAFADLIAVYRKEVNAEFATVLDHMAGLSKDVILELRERLEHEPEKVSTNDLLKIAEATLDRTGHPKVSEVNNNFNFGDRLQAARERAKKARLEASENAKLIEGRVSDE